VETESVYTCCECGEVFVVSAEARLDQRFVVTCPLCGTTELVLVATDEVRREGRAA
jgi:DNA-directed RNA polymerase subunit RPC12/RpoP